MGREQSHHLRLRHHHWHARRALRLLLSGRLLAALAAMATGVEYFAMGDAARRVLKTFEALSETEQGEVLAQLLHRAADLPHTLPSGEELLRAPDQVFQELDRREAKG